MSSTSITAIGIASDQPERDYILQSISRSPASGQFHDGQDGSKIVNFECVQITAPMAQQSQFNPNLTYNYRTDQELLDASRNAQIYCMNNGSPQVISKIVTNSSGIRTVAFQCSWP